MMFDVLILSLYVYIVGVMILWPFFMYVSVIDYIKRQMINECKRLQTEYLVELPYEDVWDTDVLLHDIIKTCWRKNWRLSKFMNVFDRNFTRK